MSEVFDTTQELGTRSIPQLLWKYALPSIITQIIATVYNLVDSIFLGHTTHGALILAALAIVLPIMNIIHAFGSLVGAGAGARMSIVLGRKDIRWAEKILGNSMFLTFFFGALFLSGGYLFMDAILTLFGASGQTVSLAHEYLVIVLPGMFLTTLTFNLSGLIRATGYATRSMWIQVSGALLNIALDAVFINVLGWGIRGAAWATTISMAFSAALALMHFISPKSFIRFRRHCWTPKMYIVKNILAIGISPFSMNVAGCLVVALLNSQLIRFGGDLAVSAYGTDNRIMFLVFSILIGINQGMQPIAGYNYGADLHDRLKQTFLLTMKWNVAIGIVGCLMAMFIPGLLVGMMCDDPQLIDIAVPALRYMMVMCPLISFTVTNSQFFQSIDKPWIAIVTSLSRQVIFLIPLMYIIPALMLRWGGHGLTGVWLSLTVSDVLGAVLSGSLLLTQLKVFRPDYVAPERKPRKERGPEDNH
ncbi:MAG: MATE family efflux transporter [Bacteroidales bacterium]|nr:MATE family efflux transporter [Candidatus Colimorpha merdihippi]